MKTYTYRTIISVAIAFIFQGCISEVQVNIVDSSTETKTNPSEKDKEKITEKKSPTTFNSGMVPAENLYAKGVHLYAFEFGDNKLHFIDTSDPADLNLEITIEMDSTIYDVYEFSNYLFITTADAGLKIFDISNFESPLIVSDSNFSTYDLRYIYREGNTLYISSRADGVILVDINTPTSPNFISQYIPPSGSIYDSLKIGNHLFLANGPNGMLVLDITTPASPSLLTTHAPSSGVSSITEIENYGNTIVAGDSSDLDIIDVTTPASPNSLTVLDFSSLYSDGYFEVHNNILYYTIAERGIIYYDLTTPATPKNLGAFNTQGYTNNLSHSGTHLYIADESGIAVLDTSDLIGIELLSKTALPSVNSKEFVKEGDFIYMITSANNLEIIDVSNPSAPLARGSLNFSGSLDNIKVSGNYAFITHYLSGVSRKVNIIDISDPDNPLDGGGFTQNAHWEESTTNTDGNYFYAIDVSANPDELVIYDITTTPGTPILVSSTPLDNFIEDPSYINGIVLRGNYIFLSHAWTGIEVIDATNKTSLVHVPTTEAKSWAFDAWETFDSGNYVAIKEDYYGLSIANIADPTNPYVVNNIFNWNGYFYGFQTQGNYMFITGNRSGLEILDMSNEYTAIELGGYNAHPDNLYGIELEGNTLYTTSSTDFYIFDISDKQGLELVSYYNKIFYRYSNSVQLNQYQIETDDYGDLLVFDTTSNDKTPIYRQRFSNSTLYDISLIGNHLQIKEENDSVVTFDFSDPTSPQLISRTFDHRQMCGSKILEQNDFVFCRGGYKGLSIYDVTDINNPTFVSLENSVYNFFYHNNTMYSYYGSGLYHYDISDPYNVVETTIHDPTPTIRYIYPYKNFIFISMATNGFSVLDITNPLAAAELATITDTVDYDQILYANDEIVIVRNTWTSSKLAVVDIRNPSSPVMIQTLDLGYSTREIKEIDGEIIMSTYGSSKTITINPDMTINVN